MVECFDFYGYQHAKPYREYPPHIIVLDFTKRVRVQGVAI